MAKNKKKLFECQSCGLQSAKWIGKCSSCGSWDSFLELSNEQIESLKSTISAPYISKAISIDEVEEDDIIRFDSYDDEFNRVLGGGIVPGSLVLIGGSPGVGKSTLLLKIAGNIAQQKKKVLYVTGEESVGQIKLRANRLEANSENLFLLPEIKLEDIKEEIKNNYDLIIIDSIQTIYSDKLTSAPGSVSQVREITFDLMRIAKDSFTSIFIIGHITKDGSIAGPRVLEHMVDTVLYFEGDSSRELRILRGFKNRFGTTSEIGIFEMSRDGLTSAKNISAKFFSSSILRAGSAVTVILEGSRAIVLEIQALVSETNYPNPKRSATGFDNSRLTMLLALLEKKLDLPFNQYDVFINVSGGIKISETAGDLAVISAIISSFRNRAISQETIFIGEVTLTGEVRDVLNLNSRLNEAKTQGFTKAIIAHKPKESIEGLKLFEINEVSKVIEWM